jgi:hypothetical protein
LPGIQQRNVCTSLPGEGERDPVANACYFQVRLRRAENNLFYRATDIAKEHSAHQATNLFAGEIVWIPKLGATSGLNLW